MYKLHTNKKIQINFVLVILNFNEFQGLYFKPTGIYTSNLQLKKKTPDPSYKFDIIRQSRLLHYWPNHKIHSRYLKKL